MVPMYMKAPEFFVGFSGAITGVIGMGKELISPVQQARVAYTTL